MILHKLLQRQIKKHLTEEMLLDPMMNKFISSINDSYNSFDRDKEIIEHAFTVSESEYSEVNHSLQKEVILKRISIQKLKDALVKIDSDYPIHAEREDDDILTIVDYLNHQIEKRKQMEEQIIWQEEKYRNIIANMNLGLLEVDNNDVIQFANQSFCDMSGYTIDELIGKRGNAIALSENEKDLIFSKNELRKAGASDMYTIAIKNKAGEIRWWVISGAPRYNDKGELVGTVGVHLDITDQKNMEEELKVAKLRAEDSSKAKETFLATMSHEIRTPLNAIIGITDLMKTNQKSRNKENLDILSFSSKNLLALITDILDLSKIDAGKIEICKNPIEIKALLNGIFQTFKPIGEEKDVELILNIEDSIPEIINGDELRLSQILNNLLSNALKFTPKGYVKLSVKAVPIDNNIMRFEFKLTDTGIGIKKNKLDSIFNDFEQADAEIVRHYGGTGLGLGITKKLIELHGGTITVESKINFGTTFSFTIDYEVSKETVKKKSDKRGGSKIVKLFTIKNKTVLLVEDNIANQKVATSYLSKWGLKSKVANNGKEALEMMASKHFDIVLVDLFMPVMDGFETIKQIRKNKAFKNLPIIALTASAENNLMDRALALGADKCMTKPFNAQQLQNAISGLLNIEELKKAGKFNEAEVDDNGTHYNYINMKRIEEASLGSKTFILEMLDIINKEVPELIIEAEFYFEKREYDRFSKVVHKMKNNLLMIGLETLREDLGIMEEYSVKEERLEEIAAAMEQLKITWSNALPEMEEVKKQLQ